MIMTITGFLFAAALALAGWAVSIASGVGSQTASVRDTRLDGFIGLALICAAVGVGYSLGAQ